MLRHTLAALAAVAWALAGIPQPAFAQQAPVYAKTVTSCGSASYQAGPVNPITQDTTGKLCDSGSGGGAGTVTEVSVTPNAGVTGVVTNPTTTPAIAISLGAITPTSVHTSTTIDADGALLSGVNGANAGALGLFGGSTGEAIIQAPAAAGSPTLLTPTVSGTLAASATTPIVLNATTGAISCSTCAVLGTAQTFTAAQRGSPVTVTISTATFTPDFSLGNNFVVTLVHASCPCTLANPTNIVAGQSGTVQIIQSGTGSDLITTYGGDWKFPGGTKPTYSTGTSAVDVLSYYVADSTHIQTSTFGLNFQ